MKKLQKCAPNAPNGGLLCHKSEDLYPKSEAIYYINVPQSEGGEKKCPIEALVREKAEFRGHSTNFEIEIKRVRKREIKDRERGRKSERWIG